MAKKGFEPKSLARSEVVLLGSDDHVVALGYTPGETPVVVAKANGPSAKDLIWCAQEMGLPLVECPELDATSLNGVQVDGEINEKLYRAAAQAIALTQRSRAVPNLVRLVRTTSNPPRALANRLKKRVEEVLDELEVAQLEVEVGGQDLAGRLQPLLTLHRQRLHIETGIPLSEIRLTVKDDLQPMEYRVKLLETTECLGLLENADDPGPVLRALYQAVERSGWRLVGYRETEALVNGLRKSQAKLHRHLFPERLSLGALRQILRNLLKEGLMIRKFPAILEAIADQLDLIQDPDQLTEYVRSAFSRELTQRFSDSQGVLHAMLMDPNAEQMLLHQIRQSAAALWLELDLDTSLKLLGSAAKGVEKAKKEGFPLVVLCSPRPRRFVRRLLEPTFPDLPVLSYSEVAPMTEVRTIGSLSI